MSETPEETPPAPPPPDQDPENPPGWDYYIQFGNNNPKDTS